MKYLISKVDGSKVDDDAVYYVLRLDKAASNPEFRRACRTGMRSFIRSLKNILDFTPGGNPFLNDIIYSAESIMKRTK